MRRRCKLSGTTSISHSKRAHARTMWMPKDWFLQLSAVTDSICIMWTKTSSPWYNQPPYPGREWTVSHRSVCSCPVIVTSVQAPDQAKHGKKKTWMPTGVTWSKSKQNKYIISKINIRMHHLNLWPLYIMLVIIMLKIINCPFNIRW